ncbi:MAG: hypothetical protein ACM31O_04535 [Bacteroidota bacterium]
MSNEHRAEWARKALAIFARATGQDLAHEMDEAIGDLICDLLHLANQRGRAPIASFLKAVQVFASELYDEDDVGPEPAIELRIAGKSVRELIDNGRWPIRLHRDGVLDLDLDASGIAWQAWGKTAGAEKGKLFARIDIDGVRHYLEAIEVTTPEDGPQRAAHAEFNAAFAELSEYVAGDGPLNVVTIEGRTYALSLVPGCQ